MILAKGYYISKSATTVFPCHTINKRTISIIIMIKTNVFTLKVC